MFPGGDGAGARDERVADDLVELRTVTQRRVAGRVAAAPAASPGPERVAALTRALEDLAAGR